MLKLFKEWKPNFFNSVKAQNLKYWSPYIAIHYYIYSNHNRLIFMGFWSTSQSRKPLIYHPIQKLNLFTVGSSLFMVDQCLWDSWVALTHKFTKSNKMSYTVLQQTSNPWNYVPQSMNIDPPQKRMTPQ